MSLDKVKVGYSSLTDTIYLYRYGKDPAVALEKREAEADVMAVVVEHMMHDAPKGSAKQVSFGGQRFEIQVTPVRGKS